MKRMSNDDKIIAALDAIDKSTKDLNKFGARYDEYIDKAALSGDDKRAKQLIKQKIGVYALAGQLDTLKANIELGAYTSKAVADMGKLPAALAGCKGLLSESPNFNKVSKDIKKIFKDMQRPVQELTKLNDILGDVLSPQEEPSLSSRLDQVDPTENSDKFNAEYAAMMERIKAKVAPTAISTPTDNDISITSDINFDGIIAEENKKK